MHMCIKKKALNNSTYILNKVLDMTPGWVCVDSCEISRSLCKFLFKLSPVEMSGVY